MSSQHGPLVPSEPLPRLGLAVESAEAVRYAAAPTIALRLAVEADRPVRSLSLNAQIRIVPTRREFAEGDQKRLVELFGTPERWGDTLRGFLWTNTTVVSPPFEGSTQIDLTVPATYDLEVASAKYFDALRDGDVPLELLFSGSVFYSTRAGCCGRAGFRGRRRPRFRLPVAVWKEAIEATSRTPRGCASTATSSTGSSRTRPGARCRHGRRRSRSCSGR